MEQSVQHCFLIDGVLSHGKIMDGQGKKDRPSNLISKGEYAIIMRQKIRQGHCQPILLSLVQIQKERNEEEKAAKLCILRSFFDNHLHETQKEILRQALEQMYPMFLDQSDIIELQQSLSFLQPELPAASNG